MAQQQQTVLRVQTNKQNPNIIIPEGAINIISGTTGISYGGSGTTLNPYTGTTTGTSVNIELEVLNTGGILNFSFTGTIPSNVVVFINNEVVPYTVIENNQTVRRAYFSVNNGNLVTLEIASIFTGSSMQYLYLQPNLDESIVYENLDLDLYQDIPIKITKSFSEIQDISKRNSDYSIGLKLPGSKMNNAFFENYYNVDADSLFFDVTKRTPCRVLIDDEIYFEGYLRLNKTSVKNSAIEYDITLYSTVGDLFGKIGNNLLRELNWDDVEYTFNHNFDKYVVQNTFYSIFGQDNPPNYFYPIVHNGYEYTTGGTVNLSGATVSGQTRLYTSTIVGSWATPAAAYSAGVKRYRINSPEDGLLDNQLKPALNVASIIRLMFKTYGYKIKSEFFNTPWFKVLYTYGYFSSDATKFSYTVMPGQSVASANLGVFLRNNGDGTFTMLVIQDGIGNVPTPRDLTMTVVFTEIIYTNPITYLYYYFEYTISAGAATYTAAIPFNYQLNSILSSSSTVPQTYSLTSVPQQPVNTTVLINENNFVDFGLVMDDKIKQIDFLSSIAKKFNLVFIQDPEDPNQIIIEPYTYYIGSGNIYDWTNKISFDKGFTVEPALNLIESDIYLSDADDGDYGNQEFKNRNNRTYGENYVYNKTDFKSQVKKIETIFSPEVLRQWDTIDTAPNGEIKFPLGINYASKSDLTNDSNNSSEQVILRYTGLKTKPKLFYYLDNYSPFTDTLGEVFIWSGYVTTNQIVISESDGTGPRQSYYAPIISHTMPLGNSDENKINNDSICSLFKCQEATNIGVSTYDAFSEQDAYKLFYQNRIDNLYDINTRFVKGYFHLDLTDIKNLKPNDLIKINEQYFTWNKIDGYNLTAPDLTSVELIQFNNTLNEYPTRYFMYYYCDSPNVIFKFKTDMTNPSLSGTSYGWSIFYDYNIGALTGATKTGFTSTVRVQIPGDFAYIPYYMYEVDEPTYNSGGTGRTYDVVWTTAIQEIDGDLNKFNYPAYVRTYNSPSYDIFNLWEDCDAFESDAITYDITTGSSGNAPSIIYSSGITINVTSIGWIKYNTASGTVYSFRSGTGSQVLSGCIDCTSIMVGIPYAQLATFTITNCGTACP